MSDSGLLEPGMEVGSLALPVERTGGRTYAR